MDAHTLTLHHTFIAVSLPYLTESEQHACFPRTGHDEISIPTGFFCHAFGQKQCAEKRRRVSEGDYTAKCPSNADIRDGEGEGMDLISVSHASHGSPC